MIERSGRGLLRWGGRGDVRVVRSANDDLARAKRQAGKEENGAAGGHGSEVYRKGVGEVNLDRPDSIGANEARLE